MKNNLEVKHEVLYENLDPKKFLSITLREIRSFGIKTEVRNGKKATVFHSFQFYSASLATKYTKPQNPIPKQHKAAAQKATKGRQRVKRGKK